MHDDGDHVLVWSLHGDEVLHQLFIDLIDPVRHLAFVPESLLEHFVCHFLDLDVNVFDWEGVVILNCIDLHFDKFATLIII